MISHKVPIDFGSYRSKEGPGGAENLKTCFGSLCYRVNAPLVEFDCSLMLTGCSFKMEIDRSISTALLSKGFIRKCPSLVGRAVILRTSRGYSRSRASMAWYAVGNASPVALIRKLESVASFISGIC